MNMSGEYDFDPMDREFEVKDKGKKGRKGKNRKNEEREPEDKKERPDHLICSQCEEMFVYPTLLPCMDTFCHECLLKLIPEPEPQANNQAAPEGNNQAAPPNDAVPPPEQPVSGAVEPPVEAVVEQKPPEVMVACPTCQKEIKAETITKKELPVQYLFQNEIDAHISREAGGPRCGECIDKNEVVGYCTTCSLSMCEECQKSHQRLNKFAAHKIKDAKQVSEDQLLKGYKKYCDTHNNEFELRYFCTADDCKILICSECKDSKKHRSHDVFLASEILDETKVLVDGKINIGYNASKNLNDFLKVSERMVEQSKDDRNTSICAIEQSFTSLENMLKEQKKKLIDQITQNHEAGTKSLEKGKADATTLRKLLDYSAMALDAAGQFGNIEVMTELGKQIEQMYEVLAVDQINETAVTIPPDGVAANQPTVEVFGVLNTIFDQNKGKVGIQVTKKTVTAKIDALTTITNTCRQAMELFNQN